MLNFLKKPVLKTSLIIFSFFLGNQLLGQTTRGVDFWLTPLLNYQNNDSFFVIVSSEKATSAVVSIPAQSWSISLTLGYNDLQRVYIPKNYKPTAFDAISDLGIRVTANLPVSVYALSAQNYTTDASCIFPSASIPAGSSFYTANPTLYASGYNIGNSLGIVCIDDSCSVTITPAYETRTTAYPANTPFTVKLKQGQVFLTGSKTGKPFAGTLVKAQAGKRIAVFCGDDCVATRCAACDHVYEEIPPTNTLGKNFIIPPFLKQNKGYDYQIVATQNNTTVQENGVFMRTMDAGDTLYRVVYSDTTLCVSSDKPILLAQYMTGINCQSPKGGDPSMLIINPNEQTISKAKVSTANTGVIKQHYITLIVPSNGVDSTYLDGSLIPKSDYRKSNCNNFYYYQDTIGAGNHNIENSFGFISYLYGIGSAESYAYGAGSSLKNLNRYIVAKTYPSCDSGYLVKLTSVGDSATAFKWLFNNSQKDTAKNPYFMVPKPGIYPVKLWFFGYIDKVWDSTLLDVLIEAPQNTDLIPYTKLTICDTGFTFKLPVSKILSYKWNTGDTTAQMHVNKTGRYTVSIKNNINGCVTADSADIIFQNKINVNFGHIMTAYCSGQTLFLRDSTKLVKDTVKQYAWYSDKKLHGQKQNDSIPNAVANNYEIKLVIKTNKGCSDSITKNILILDKPIAKVSLKVFDSCVLSNKFSFVSTSKTTLGKIKGYKWLFSNGDTSNSQNVIKKFNGSGQIKYRLVAYGETGCNDTTKQAIATIYPKPSAGFSISDSSICKNGNFFNFINNTQTDPYAKGYTWMWGDGTGSTFQDPGTINYSDTGKFLVTLSAYYTATGCADTVRRFVRVVENPVPKIILDSSDFCLHRNYFQFKGTNSTPNISPKYLWKWGDGSQTPDSIQYRKKYATPGTYTLKLFLSLGKNCVDSVKKTVIVYNDPVADFSLSDSVFCGLPAQLNVTNKSTAPANAKWQWNFGNSVVSSLKNPAQVDYSDTGKYTILLIAKDPLTTCDNRISKKIIVYKFPGLKPRLSDTAICNAKTAITFTDSTDYGNLPVYRKWQFSKTDTSNSKIITKNFAGKGIYNIQLIGGLPGLCADTSQVQVRVKYSDTAGKIVHTLTEFCAPAKVDLTAKPHETANWSYLWDFGNSQTSTLPNPVSVQFNDSLQYKIKLTLNDGKGCEMYLYDTIKIAPKPEAFIFRNLKDTQCLKGNNFVFNAAVNKATAPVQYKWDCDESNTFSTQNTNPVIYKNLGKKIIQLIIQDAKGCRDTAKFDSVLVLPQMQVTLSDTWACVNKTIVIKAKITPANMPVSKLDWYVNNNYQQTGNSFNWAFNTPGKDSIYVIATSAGGCKDSSAKAYLITYANPIAAFGTEILNPTGTGIVVKFLDSSVGATKWTWYPEKTNLGITGNTKKYDYNYQSLGQATILLRVENSQGCKDSTYRTILLKSDELVWFPSSFTPNGDGKNDVFKPEGMSPVKSYTLRIYNRWGAKVFETSDPTIGWDGIFMNQAVMSGSYVYSVNLVFFTGKRLVINNNFTLIR